MKIPNLRAKFKPKGYKGNIHFGKIVLTFMLVGMMILGNVELVKASELLYYYDVYKLEEYDFSYSRGNSYDSWVANGQDVYPSFRFDKNTGLFYTEGESFYNSGFGYAGSPYGSRYMSSYSRTGYSVRYDDWGNKIHGINYEVRDYIVTSKKRKGTYIKTITGTINQYPVNGIQGGYWYVRKGLVNNNPTLSISTPSENSYFGKEEGYNNIPLEVYVNDSDIGDTLKAYYRINGTKGQAGIQFGGDITANGTNQKLTGTIPKETVTNLSEGTHKLYMWVEDNKGGKSTEVVRNINIDKTAPNGFTPTVIANSISEITVSGETTDSGSKLKPEPYSYKLSNDDWSEWTSEKAKKYTGLNTNTRYDFTMRAIDNVGNVRVTETIQKYTLAEAPGLTIIDASDTSIIGEINPKSNPSYTEYKIEYSLDGNTWTKIDGRNEWDTSLDFAATNLLPGKKYYVRVKARNGDKLETGYSNIENIITKPQAPVLKEPVAISGSEIKLEWDKVLSALKYHVEYKESNSSSWIKLTTTENLIKIGQLNPNEQYDFRVRSENETGLSDYSSIKNRYTKALNPEKIILKEVTGTSLKFEVVNNTNNVNDPKTKLKLEGAGETNWDTAEIKNFTNLVAGREYKLFVNTRNGNDIENGWVEVPGDIPLVDDNNNPIPIIVTVIPVKDFKVIDSSVNSLTVSWEKEDKQLYEVYLKDESGNEIVGSRSGWIDADTHTFVNLPLPNTKYVPYIITKSIYSDTPLKEDKVSNEHKAFTNAEGVSRGTFESGEDYIIITLNVNNNNPSDTEYKIKNDVTEQETTVKHSDPTWKNTNLSRESFYTYSVRVENKNKELSYFTRLMFEDGDEAHTELPNIDIPPKMIVPDEDFINLDELKDKDHGYEIGFNPEDLNGKLVQLEEEKYRVTQNRIEEIENAEEIEVINYSYSKEGFGYTDWKPLEKGKFKEKLIFNTPGIYKTHWKFKNYKIESNPALINYYADWIKPTVEGEPFIKGQSAVTGNEFKVNVKAEDNVSPYLFYSTDNGSTWHLLKEGHNIITFTNIQKTSKGIQNKLTVKIADIAGNVVEKTFTVWGIEK